MLSLQKFAYDQPILFLSSSAQFNNVVFFLTISLRWLNSIEKSFQYTVNNMCGQIIVQGQLITIRDKNCQTCLQLIVKLIHYLTKFANFFINNSKFFIKVKLGKGNHFLYNFSDFDIHRLAIPHLLLISKICTNRFTSISNYLRESVKITCFTSISLIFSHTYKLANKWFKKTWKQTSEGLPDNLFKKIFCAKNSF